MPDRAFDIRATRRSDLPALIALYRRVAAIEGGLARTAAEVTDAWVRHTLDASLARGVSMVAERNGAVAAELHAYRPEPACFAHIFSDLTIAVDPATQGQGVGRALFAAFLDTVVANHPSITRVELFARESNARAVALYESLGFAHEGRLRRRVRGVGGELEDDLVMAWHRPTA